jgi:hypothetical protein
VYTTPKLLFLDSPQILWWSEHWVLSKIKRLGVAAYLRNYDQRGTAMMRNLLQRRVSTGIFLPHACRSWISLFSFQTPLDAVDDSRFENQQLELALLCFVHGQYRISESNVMNLQCRDRHHAEQRLGFGLLNVSTVVRCP